MIIHAIKSRLLSNAVRQCYIIRCSSHYTRQTGLFPEGQDTTELFDVYLPPDKSVISCSDTGKPTYIPKYAGYAKERGKCHRDGDWHRSVHVWIFDRLGNVLLQQRSKYKDTNPLLWDVSCAGHINSGTDSLTTAVREVDEELGVLIAPESLEFLGTIPASITGATASHGEYICNEFQDVYACEFPPLQLENTIFETQDTFKINQTCNKNTTRFNISSGEVKSLKALPLKEIEFLLLHEDKNVEYVPRTAEYRDFIFPQLHNLIENTKL